jgi:GTP pyrophosphokinase
MDDAGPAYSERMVEALRVAATLHQDQFRKGTRVPYLAHLIGVCAIALEFGADEDQAIAALLHDAIEDVEPAERARAEVAAFGPEVLRIVEACTDSDEHPPPPWRARKERYLSVLTDADSRFLLVSAADKLDNVRTILTELHHLGPAAWQRAKAPRDDALWYYGRLVEIYRANPASDPALVDELARAVEAVRALA